MFRCLVFLIAAALSLVAAERSLDLTGLREGELPSGMRATMTGSGAPAAWQVTMDDGEELDS